MGVMAFGPYTMAGRLTPASVGCHLFPEFVFQTDDIGADIRELVEVGLAGVEDEQLGAAFPHGGADAGGQHAVVAGGLRADDDDGVGILQFRQRVGRVLGLGAQGGFVGDHVHAHAVNLAGEAGDGFGRFVGQARQHEQRLLGFLGGLGGLANRVERLGPRGFLQRAVFAHERREDAFARLGPGLVTALDAKMAAVDGRIRDRPRRSRCGFPW